MIKNGYNTYSKTSFREKAHPRGHGGTFKKNPHGTEKEHRGSSRKYVASHHHRGKDGTFNSEGCKLGYERYGRK